ncbi:MAG: biotin/lipoyl-containing protein [Pseudomonadota bacterium]
MSTWKIRVNGKPMEVEVEETTAGHYSVKVNGNEHKVHVDEADWGLSISPVGMGAQAAMEKPPRVVIRSGRPSARAADAASVLRPTRPAKPPESPAAMPKLPPATPPPPVAMGVSRVVSPMPGKILKVLVNIGDQVKAGDGICVLESMKMENVIPAPRAGKIKVLHVKAGDNPNTGMPLADIE